MKLLRDHGMSKTKRYWHDFVGFNYRLTNINLNQKYSKLINLLIYNYKHFLKFNQLFNQFKFFRYSFV